MEMITKDKKIEVLEHSFAASAGEYYNINLTRDLVPGFMWQIIDDIEYNLNEQMGLPENASFTDVVSYWGEKLDEKEKPTYYKFFSIPRLLTCYAKGETHVSLRYWTKSAIFEPMLAEQHIVMYQDEETQDVLAITYVLDLTHEYEKEEYKKELENALAEATLNSEIINSIGKIYWLIYRIDLCSGTYEEISAGEEMHHLTGKQGQFSDVFKDAREMVVEAAYQESMEQFLDISTLSDRLNDTESVSEEYQATNGSWHRARFIAKKRDESGKVTHVLYVVREIDQEKKKEIEYKKNLIETTEKAKQANMAKTEFLRHMSHDIRTPINGIIGLLNINKAHFDDRELVQKNQEKMEGAAMHLLSLINDILQMSKIEDGSVTLAHEKINLLEMLHQIDAIIEERAVDKGIKVEITRDKSLVCPYVYGSPVHLRQIFINICDNCIKYNRSGGKISISVDAIEKKGNHCIYRWIISDTGIGMSEEFLRHIFEPFVQEKDDARSSYTGVGLGLSIVKGLLEQMGGTISVTSEEGVGSVFVITIPFDIASDLEEADQMISDKLSIQGMKLMLVEDNELNAEIAETMLADQGADVSVVHNGKEAVDLFEQNPAGSFDAILMDIMMPVMDGLKATKVIRALQHSEADSIPIIAMTANAFQEDEETCIKAGMNAYLTKPLDIAKVKNVIYENVRKNRDIIFEFETPKGVL